MLAALVASRVALILVLANLAIANVATLALTRKSAGLFLAHGIGVASIQLGVLALVLVLSEDVFL